MRIFIDASNIISESGGYVHLKKILLSFSKKKGTNIEVAVSSVLYKTLNIDYKKNIKFYKNSLLDGNILSRIFWKFFNFNNYLKKNNFSVVYVLNGYFFFKPNRTPIAILIQNLLPFSEAGLKKSNISTLIKNKILLILYNSSIKRAELTIFPSKFFHKITKVKPKKFCIINHGVEKVFFQKRKNYKIYNNKDLSNPFKIMYLSKFEGYKNHINLVRASYLLKKKGFNISLSLIGLHKDLIKNTKLLKLIDNFNNQFPKLIELKKLQKHKDIKKIFNKFDLHVYPSICESFGIIILETIASSLPIICSNYGVFREILKKDTLYFNPLKDDDIANKIAIYIKNHKLRKQNTNKLRGTSKSFTWKKAGNQTFNILSEISK